MKDLKIMYVRINYKRTKPGVSIYGKKKIETVGYIARSFGSKEKDFAILYRQMDFRRLHIVEILDVSYNENIDILRGMKYE